MKKHILILLFSFFTLQTGLNSQNLRALFSYSTFMIYPESPYIETYLSFDGNNVILQKLPNGNYRATVEITLSIKKNDSVFFVEKRNLLSPEVADSSTKDFSFMDIQRISLPNGIYTLELKMFDLANPEKVITTSEKLLLNYDSKKINSSSIQLISNINPTTKENILSKGGYDIEPYISDFIPENINKLLYYIEFYNLASVTGMGKPFVVYSSIESYETGKKFTDYQWQKRELAKNTNIILSSFNIENLPSGNYNLKVELRDSTNSTFFYKTHFFQRSNPYVTMNTDFIQEMGSFAEDLQNDSILTFYIQSLEPIASESEKNFVLHLYKRASLKEKQSFFNGFWVSRNAKDPKAEWIEYYKKLSVVESKFSTPIKKGYQTDRGRVYLVYGPPNHIIDEKFRTSSGMKQHERAAYVPYQMWRYDNIPNSIESMGMFVFWAPQSLSDYQLLNSNVTGELSDQDWETRLSRGGIDSGDQGEAGRQFIRGY